MIFSRQALLWAIQSSSLAVALASTVPRPPDTSSHVYSNESSFTSSSSTKTQEPLLQYDTAVSAPISRGALSRSTTSNSTTSSGPIRTVVLPPLTSTLATTTASPKVTGTSGNDGGTGVEQGVTSKGGKTPPATSTSSSGSKSSMSSLSTQYTKSGKTSTSTFRNTSTTAPPFATSNTTTYRSPSTITPPYISSNKTTYIPSITQPPSTAPCVTLGKDEPSTVWVFAPNPSTTTITIYANATNATTSTYSTIPEFTPPTYCPTLTSTSEITHVGSPFSTTSFSNRPQGITVTFPLPPASRPTYGTSEGFGASSRPVTTVVITSKNPTTEFTTLGGISYPGLNTEKVQPTGVNWVPNPGPPGDFIPTPISISTVNPTPAPPALNPGNDGGSQGTGSNPPANNPPAGNPSNNSPGNNPGSPGADSSQGSGNGQPVVPATPTTKIIGGVPVVVEPTKVIIGTLTVPVPTGNSGSEASNGGGGGGSGSIGSGSNGSGSSGSNGGSGSGSGSNGSGSNGSGSNGSGSNGNNPSNDGGNGVVTDSNGNEVVVQNGQTFTVNPSQVVGPGGTTIDIPPPNPTVGGQFRESPEPTIISGVPIQLGNAIAVISGTTYSIGTGAPQTTITVNGQTISIGPSGLGFASTTVAPKLSLPTNIVVIGGQVFSAIGASLAVIGTSTITYGGNIPTKTDTFNGATITLAPSGILYDSSSLGGPANPKNTQIGLAGGLTISEIGSTLAVISGVTLTIGPGVTSSVTVINGHTITAGPSGLGLASTTLSYPFNPTTRAVTAGGITYSEIGPSLVVIGGTTFTVGPGAKTTTDVYGGQSISIGPGGVGFSTTTIPPARATATATGKKNGASRAGSGFGVLGVCIGIIVGFVI